MRPRRRRVTLHTVAPAVFIGAILVVAVGLWGPWAGAIVVSAFLVGWLVGAGEPLDADDQPLGPPPTSRPR